jgi:hypothetical protein
MQGGSPALLAPPWSGLLPTIHLLPFLQPTRTTTCNFDMKGWIVVGMALCAAGLLACGCAAKAPSVEAPSQQGEPTPADPDLVGVWVTIATSAGHYDDVLTLDGDWTFRSETTFRKDGTQEVTTGRYSLQSRGGRETLVLVPEVYNGDPVPGEYPLPLDFDRREQRISQMFPGVAYVRPAGEKAGS